MIERDKKGKEKDKGWSCDLVSKALIVARYFAKEQAAIEQLSAELESVTAQLTELEEEHGGEDAVFSGFDIIYKGSVAERLREIKADKSSSDSASDETAVLNSRLKFAGDEAQLKTPRQGTGRSPRCRRARALVVDDKSLAHLSTAIHGEMDRISQALIQRVKELAERYDTPMPQMVSRVAALEAKVAGHLVKMGFAA